MSTALPRSLQAMIADCVRAVESWTEEERRAEENEYFVRLSRGEYEARLYWECVAEDCEVDGNWNGAKAAYAKALANAKHDIEVMKTRLSLGHLHAILDENRAALAHYHRASRLLRGDESRILYRTCLVVEGQHLLRTGCVRRAERCARRGLNCLDPGGGDLFSYANLLALRAGCEIARRNETAAVTLREAWPCLEQLTELSRKVGLEDVGSGVHAAYATWWTTEAARRRLTGDVSGELEAAQQALDRTRRGAAGWNTLVWNAGVMRALRRLAEAYERADQHAEAEQRRTEAEAIRIRWHLPLHRFKPSLVARLKLTIRRRGSLR